ncbi:flippase [Gracilimonas sp.]|uniref:flippase n=1 Tax=Gracilimonas sp. TaxID=1974203 RepID=UPI003D0D89CD
MNSVNTQVLKNVTWHYIYRFIKLGLAFFITAWFARYLGAEKYGAYVYAVALAEMIMLFWSQGLKEVVVHEIKKEGLEKGEVSNAAFQMMLMGNVVLYGILGGILFLFIGEQVLVILSLLCGLGILFRSFEGYELWFHARLRIKITVWIQLISQIIYMTANIIFILSEADLVWFGVAYAGQLMLVGSGFAMVYAIEKGRIAFFGNYRRIQQKLFESGKYMMLAKLTLTSSFLVDRFIIEYLITMEAVGYFSAAMKMTTTLTFIASSIALSFIPILSAAVSDLERNQIIKDMFGWITSSALFLMIPFYLFADSLVFLVFGEGYQNSVPIFKILVLSLPFILLNEGVKSCLVTSNKTKYYILAMAFTTITAIVVNLLLIPLFSLVGAALAFVISWISGTIFTFLFFKETRFLGKQILASFLYPIILVLKHLSSR